MVLLVNGERLLSSDKKVKECDATGVEKSSPS